VPRSAYTWVDALRLPFGVRRSRITTCRCLDRHAACVRVVPHCTSWWTPAAPGGGAREGVALRTGDARGVRDDPRRPRRCRRSASLRVAAPGG
jgi:hypothetical protein